MTNREEQILEWIKENPMISQNELAEKANITRSSVAVHISNLMKKGYIAGKGYVISHPDYAVVVGGVNKDIGGIPFKPLVPKDSNPGKVNTSIGGVGRNIAHNMSLLGVNVKLLTALGDDPLTEAVINSCNKLGIDISHAQNVAGVSNATYLFIDDADGDMVMAISDMEIFDYVTPYYLQKNRAVINESRLVISDTNIPEESLYWLADNTTVPLFVDPVSTIKAEKLKGILGKIHTLKPNILEAEYLSGVKIRNDEDLPKAADALLATGMKRVFISLGKEGVYCATEEEAYKLPSPEVELLNSTGGGDAFMGALGWAWMNGLGLKESAMLGTGAAAIAVESSRTINDELTIEAALDRAGLRIEIKNKE